jgi:hypothetical protein
MTQRARIVIAISLLLISLLSSFLIAAFSNHKTQIWMARSPLPAGHEVVAEDFVSVPVGLPRDARGYLSSRYSLRDVVTIRSIREGELLSSGSIAAKGSQPILASIPISVKASDLPANLQVGEEVDLVHTGDGERLVIEPAIVANAVAIVGLERKSSSFSGQVTVTIGINRLKMLPLIAASSVGRIVVVRTHA